VGIECHRHRPRRLAGRNDVDRFAFERIKYAARGRGSEQTTGIDCMDTRTQDVLQVGADSGKKIAQ
jgi:hypothetical protein